MAATSANLDFLLKLQQEVISKILRRTELRSVLDDLCRLVEGAVEDSVCSIMRVDTARDVLVVESAPSAPDALIDGLNGLVPAELAGSCGSAVFTGEMVIVADTLVDPRWEQLRPMAAQFGIRSCWSVPFFSGDGETLGTFAISHPRVKRPSDDDVRVLRTAGQLVGIAVDRARDEAALRDQRALLDSILESTADPVFAKDRSSRYLVLNTATATSSGATVDEMMGRTDHDFFPPEIARRFTEADAHVLRTGEGVHHELTVRHPVIGERTYLIRKNPLRAPDGTPVGVVGIARDVTELRQAEKAMQNAQKLETLGVLAGGIAHDFNNLLTGVMGHAELARQRLDADSPAAYSLGEIQKAAERAAELIDQMLAYSGRAESVKEPVSLPALVRDVHSLIVCSISKKAELRFEFDDGVPAVEADGAQLRQVVMNLLTNASEALFDRPGRITIGARLRSGESVRRDRRAFDLPARDYVELTVADTGEGMDEATVARIFDPFFTTKFTGRGLGLAAVQGIVRTHAGWIGVESAPGAGTTFTVLLPALGGRAAGSVKPSAPATTERGVVLIVDDEETVRTLTAEVLGDAGFETLSVVDGVAAVEELGRTAGRVDAVILDFTTPRLGGREAFESLRRLRPDLPVILTSGFDEREATRDFRPGELADFVKKPFRTARLLAAVRAALLEGAPASPNYS